MRLHRLIAHLRGRRAAGERVEQAIARVDQRLDELDARVNRLFGAIAGLAADEPGNRERLASARAQRGYDRGWTEKRPLISVTIATRGRPELVERALPSVLGQTYGELEVIVAGDGTGPQTEEDVRAIGDDRVRFVDLGARFEWTRDPRKLWLVGATRGQNAATAGARGRWIAPFDDDDAMRPDCLERLLELARRTRAEIVYGRVHFRLPNGEEHEIGEFPPRLGQFSWAAGMHRAELRSFRRELIAAELDRPGDWWLAERMIRAGARFAMVDDVLCDGFPSGHGSQWVADHRDDLA
jgi:hypothetical protein